MVPSAESGYAQVKRQMQSPRATEYQILMNLASEIECSDPKTLDGYKRLAAAVKKNTDLWTIFVTDLSKPENPLPTELKDGLIKLAAFSIAHGSKVLGGKADKEALVNVNRSVAEGLREAAQAAA